MQVSLTVKRLIESKLVDSSSVGELTSAEFQCKLQVREMPSVIHTQQSW